MSKPTVSIAVTLLDGTRYSQELAKLPRHWMSVAMALAPYGTNFQGARYTRTRLSDGLTKVWPA